MTTVKVIFGEELRRFSLSFSENGFQELCQALSESYGFPKHELRITYVDDEQDKCVIGGDEEFREALRFFQSAPAMKLQLEHVDVARLSSLENSPRLSVVPSPEDIAVASTWELVANADACPPVAATSSSSPTPVVEAPAAAASIAAAAAASLANPPAVSAFSAEFLEDVSIPDNSFHPQGATITKMWAVKNIGERAWPKGCQLVFVGGELEPAVQKEIFLPEANPNEVVMIAVDLVVPFKSVGAKAEARFQLIDPLGLPLRNHNSLWAHVQLAEECEMKHPGPSNQSASAASSELPVAFPVTPVASVPPVEAQSSPVASPAASLSIPIAKKEKPQKEKEPKEKKKAAKREKGVDAQVHAPSVQLVRDVTLPVLPCGGRVIKVWEVQNTGSVAWPENCRLTWAKIKGGENRLRPSADASELVVPPLAPGEIGQLSVELQLPGKHHAGTHLAHFELVDPFENRFESDALPLVVSLQVETPAPELTRAQFLRQLPIFLRPPLLNGEMDLEVRKAMADLLEANPLPATHHGIKCDGCGQCPLVGVRYKCSVCVNFDLCHTCESRNLHPANHAMIKVKQPEQAPAAPAPVMGGMFGGWGRRHHHMATPPSFPTPATSTASSPRAESVPWGLPLWGRRTSGTPGGCGRDWRSGPAVVDSASGALPSAEFVKDVTVLDGSVVIVGSKPTKTWSIKNNGTVPWPEGTTLIYVNGDITPTPDVAPVVPLANPGETVQVSVVVVIPSKPGRYTGYFRLCSPFKGDRRKFGPRVWMDVLATQVLQPLPPVDGPAVAADAAGDDKLARLRASTDPNQLAQLLELAGGDSEKVLAWVGPNPSNNDP